MGGADAGRTVWRIADNLERRYSVSCYFRGQKIKNRYVDFHVKYNI